MVEGCEPVVVTAIFNDDHGLVVLNPDVDPVGHDDDLADLDADLVDLDVNLYLCDVCDMLLCLLLSPDTVELVEEWDDDVHLTIHDDLI